MLRPPAMAAALAPFPRCRVMRLVPPPAPPQVPGRLPGDVGVRGAVETVAAHPVLLVEFVGNGIAKGVRR